MDQHQLKRSLSLPTVVFYGLGTILGAGVYVLIGKVAAAAGYYAPLAFLLAAVIAFFTAISYAELSSRLPFSAGEAVYVRRGLQKPGLAAFVGWMVVITGVVSAATLCKGFVGYLQIFMDVSPNIAITLSLLGLTALAAWGIQESAFVISLITLIEVGGLLFVIGVALTSTHNGGQNPMTVLPDLSWADSTGIVLGAFIAFYAFIGFEDMVNIAEEVKNPRKVLPKAILIAIIISTILYLLVSVLAIRVLPLDVLANSDAPLATMVAYDQRFSPQLISVISLIAILNGALVQLIMGSRVLYGMGTRGGAPKFFAKIYSRTQTPVLSTVLLAVTILILALSISLVGLAQITSFVILCVFALIHLSLIALKRREPEAETAVTYSIAYLIIGFLLICGFIFMRVLDWF